MTPPYICMYETEHAFDQLIDRYILHIYIQCVVVAPLFSPWIYIHKYTTGVGAVHTEANGFVFAHAVGAHTSQSVCVYILCICASWLGALLLTECAVVAYSGGTSKALHLSPCHSNVPAGAGYVRARRSAGMR